MYEYVCMHVYVWKLLVLVSEYCMNKWKYKYRALSETHVPLNLKSQNKSYVFKLQHKGGIHPSSP